MNQILNDLGMELPQFGLEVGAGEEAFEVVFELLHFLLYFGIDCINRQFYLLVEPNSQMLNLIA